jgi:hypothetical protein
MLLLLTLPEACLTDLERDGAGLVSPWFRGCRYLAMKPATPPLSDLRASRTECESAGYPRAETHPCFVMAEPNVALSENPAPGHEHSGFSTTLLSDMLHRLRTPIIAFVVLLVLYLGLSRGIGLGLGIAIFVVLGAIYLIWPNDAMLLVTPGLLPTVNLDLGLGRSPFPIILVAVLIGQCRRGQWRIRIPVWLRRRTTPGPPMRPSRRDPQPDIMVGRIPQTLLYGWLLLILALAASTFLNERDYYPDFLVWLVRGALMLTYVSAWQHSARPEYGLWGWVIAGLLMLPAAAMIYRATGSVLAIREEGLTTMGEGSTLSVMYLLLSVSGFLVVSFWCVWALQSIGVLPSPAGYLLSVAFAPALLFSGRRQALLAMVLSLGYYLLTTPLRKSWRLLAILALALCFVCYSGFLTQFMEGRESIRDEFEGRGTGRLSIYEAGLDAFLEKPVLGWGLGSYNDITLSSGIVSKRTGGGGASHNTLVGVAAEAGILGLLGVVLVLVGAVKPTLSLASMTRQRGLGPWTYAGPILGFVLAGTLVSRVIEDNWYLLSLAMLCGVGDRLARAFGEYPGPELPQEANAEDVP